MKNINLKEIIGNATPDMDGSYRELLAALNVKLAKKTETLEKLREEAKTTSTHKEWRDSKISSTMCSIEVTKGEIIRTLLDFDYSLANKFFDLVEA